MTGHLLEQLKKETGMIADVNPNDLEKYCFLEEFSFKGILACSRKQSIKWEFIEESFGPYSYEAQYQGKFLSKELKVCCIRLSVNIDSDSVSGILYGIKNTEPTELSYTSVRKLFLADDEGLDGYNVYRIDTIALLYASKKIGVKVNKISNYFKNICEDKTNWKEISPIETETLFSEDCMMAFSYLTDIDFDIFCIVKLKEKQFPIFSPVSYAIMMNRDVYIKFRISETSNLQEMKIYPSSEKARVFFRTRHNVTESSSALKWVEEIPDENTNQLVTITDDGKIHVDEDLFDKIINKTAYVVGKKKNHDPERTLIEYKLANGLGSFRNYPLSINIHLSGFLAEAASELIPKQPLQRKGMDIYNHNGLHIGHIKAPFELEKLESCGKIRIENVYVDSVTIQNNLSVAIVKITVKLSEL